LNLYKEKCGIKVVIRKKIYLEFELTLGENKKNCIAKEQKKCYK